MFTLKNLARKGLICNNINTTQNKSVHVVRDMLHLCHKGENS